jgi:hypothetical protein
MTLKKDIEKWQPTKQGQIPKSLNLNDHAGYTFIMISHEISKPGDTRATESSGKRLSPHN